MMRRLLVAVALTTSALLSGGVAAANADTTVTVTAADLAPGGHWFTGDTRTAWDRALREWSCDPAVRDRQLRAEHA